jgi:Outer membrane protein beta-barrel domain
VKASARLLLLLLLICSSPTNMQAQRKYFAGGVGGISTLSADAQSSITPETSAVSLYRPFNGPALNVFGGIHVSDVFAVQGNYVFNANDLTLVATRTAAGAEDLFEQRRHSRQHAFVADLLVYFRNRRSWARPYLSSGVGAVQFRSTAGNFVSMRGSPNPPPEEFTSTAPALRVAVGIDLAIHSGWAFRYSFSETIRANPVSEHLIPTGERNLANFQNLFGFVKTF